MGKQSREYRCAGATPARLPGGRHAANPPATRLTVGRDETDGHQLGAVECSERERVRRLVGRELRERLVRSQNRLAQRARLRQRDRANGE